MLFFGIMLSGLQRQQWRVNEVSLYRFYNFATQKEGDNQFFLKARP